MPTGYIRLSSKRSIEKTIFSFNREFLETNIVTFIRYIKDMVRYVYNFVATREDCIRVGLNRIRVLLDHMSFNLSLQSFFNRVFIHQLTKNIHKSKMGRHSEP